MEAPGQGFYDDGVWTYSVPWAIYLMKTGDLAFVKDNFDSEGPLGAAQPSIEETRANRRGEDQPHGDHGGHRRHRHPGLLDDRRLLGAHRSGRLSLPGPHVGNASQASWAAEQYAGLLSATNETLGTTIARYHLDYVPCSILRPNVANRCKDPEDANWMSPLGAWAWDTSLFGATTNGPDEP